MGKLVLTKSLMMATLMSGLFNYKQKKDGMDHKDIKYEVHAQITNIRSRSHRQTSELVWLGQIIFQPTYSTWHYLHSSWVCFIPRLNCNLILVV